MTYFIQPVITKNGANKIAEAIANKQTITFTRIVLGKGAIKTDIENATDVASLVHTLSVAQSIAENDPNVVRVFGRLDNADINTELNITEIGVFAKVEGNAEFLFMYTWAENGDIIPPASVSRVYRDYDFATTISKDSPVVIKFENEGVIYATHEELDIFEKEVIERLNNIKVEDATLTTKGIVQLTDDVNSVDAKKVPTGKIVGDLNKKVESHIENNTKHITSAERNSWNAKADNTVVDEMLIDLKNKADKDVAQMFKLTADDGDLIILKTGDANEIDEPKKYYCRNIKNTPKPYGMLLVEKATYNGKPDIFQFFATVDDVKKEVILYWRWRNSRLFWSDVPWERLPKLADLDLKADKKHTHKTSDITGLDEVIEALTGQIELKADKSKVQIFKLTQDNGYSKVPNVDSWDDVTEAGHYYGYGLDGAMSEYQTRMHMIVSSTPDDYVWQIGNDAINETFGVRTKFGGVWKPWRIFEDSGQVKKYDIVFSGGVRARAGAKENENKVIVRDGVAHLTLNIDMSKAGSYATVTVPKEVAVNLRGNVYSNSKTEYGLVSNFGRSDLYSSNEYYSNGSIGQANKETNKMPVLSFVAPERNWSNATKMRIKFASKERGTKYKGYYSWYVGG